MPLSHIPRRRTPVAILVASAALAAPAQTVAVSKDNRTVSVTATEHVIVLADAATVHVGYLLYGKDRDAAYNAATTLSNAILKSLTASGIPLDAIESDSQGIEPVQNFQIPNPADHLNSADLANRRFQVQQSWLVHVPAPDAAKALDTAVLAGANQSGQIDWSLKDENAATATAAARAIERARTVAAQMLAPFNGKLGALLYASNESEASTIRPMAMQAMHKAATPHEPLAITPRRIEHSVTVHATFAID